MRVLLPLPAWPRRSADDHAADTSSIPPQPSDRFDSRFNPIDALVELQVAGASLLSVAAIQIQRGFQVGGSALGNVFNAIGAQAQNLAYTIVRAAGPIGLELAPNQRIVNRVLDGFLRWGNKAAWLEVKYKLPTDGAALERLEAQVAEAVATGDTVVVWALKPATFAEIRAFVERVGPEVANRVLLLSGEAELWGWVEKFFR